MVHEVYFWSHDHPEGGRDENSSKQNSTEAALAARLAFYLVQQGYDGGDITILTPYVGQLLLLRTEIRKYMRFVVSDKDAEQLAALQVASLVLFGCFKEWSCIPDAKLLVLVRAGIACLGLAFSVPCYSHVSCHLLHLQP